MWLLCKDQLDVSHANSLFFRCVFSSVSQLHVKVGGQLSSAPHVACPSPTHCELGHELSDRQLASPTGPFTRSQALVPVQLPSPMSPLAQPQNMFSPSPPLQLPFPTEPSALLQAKSPLQLPEAMLCPLKLLHAYEPFLELQLPGPITVLLVKDSHA